MKEEKITCDGCGNDLTTRSNMEDWRLVLSYESKAGYGGGFYTAMHIPVPISRTYHFCNLSCLDNWHSHEKFYDAEMKKRWDDYVDKNGAKSEDGRMLIYPSVLDDVCEQWRRESRLGSDAEFPLVKDKNDSRSSPLRISAGRRHATHLCIKKAWRSRSLSISAARYFNPARVH